MVNPAGSRRRRGPCGQITSASPPCRIGSEAQQILRARAPAVEREDRREGPVSGAGRTRCGAAPCARAYARRRLRRAGYLGRSWPPPNDVRATERPCSTRSGMRTRVRELPSGADAALHRAAPDPRGHEPAGLRDAARDAPAGALPRPHLRDRRPHHPDASRRRRPLLRFARRGDAAGPRAQLRRARHPPLRARRAASRGSCT